MWDPSLINRGRVVDRSGTIAVADGSQVLSGENPSRTYFFVQNPSSSSESLFVNLTSAASTSANNSYELLPGSELMMCSYTFISIERVSVAATTPGHAFVCKEMSS